MIYKYILLSVYITVFIETLPLRPNEMNDDNLHDGDIGKLLEKELVLERNGRQGRRDEDGAFFHEQTQSQFYIQKWFKMRDDSNPSHQIFALSANRNPVKSKNKGYTIPLGLSTMSTRVTKFTKKYHGNMMKMAKKPQKKKLFPYADYNFANIVKGHEHQEMLQSRPDLTIMVQPSKIDYARWQNDGGVRFFIHRSYSVPLDPRDSIEVDNNVETFINLEYDDVDLLSEEIQRDRGCMRSFSRKNLWYDLEVELYNPLTYTWDSCLHEWQAKTMFKACKCLPHYYSELFDYWWNKNLRCNHHGLKCMALVNGISFFIVVVKSRFK